MNPCKNIWSHEKKSLGRISAEMPSKIPGEIPLAISNAIPGEIPEGILLGLRDVVILYKFQKSF